MGLHLVLVRSGGVAGMRRAHVLDTGALPEPDAARVEHLVAAAQASVSTTDAACSPAGPVGPDRFQYAITVETRTWRLDESELAGPWGELVQLVQQRGERTAPPHL